MNRFKAIDKLMRRAVGDGIFPGGVVMAAQRDEVFCMAAAGDTSIYPGGKAVVPDTVFDLASLTKPLATTLAVMYLVADKKIDLNDPINAYLGAPCPVDKREITWLHLLCHNSGLPDHRPFYEALQMLPESERKPQLLRLILDEPLVSPVGWKTIYSDTGFLLLQLAIESVTEKSLAAFVQDHLYPMLSVSGLFFPSYDDHRVDRLDYAATEMCRSRGLLQGVVHDENAFSIGGAAGHAGLFGTCGAVYAILRKLLAAYEGIHVDKWLNSDIVNYFFTVPEKAQRPPGFDVPAPEGASCGQYFNRACTVGHLGYTGTSFWMALDRKIIVVLLTNRIHPDRRNEKIKKFRPILHDEIMRLAS